MFDTIKTSWEATKAWFHNAESIFLARATALTGLVVAAVSAMDWSPLLNAGLDTGFTIKQGVTLGSMAFVKGIADEWARRRNDPYFVVKDAAADVPATKKAIKKVKKTVKEAEAK